MGGDKTVPEVGRKVKRHGGVRVALVHTWQYEPTLSRVGAGLLALEVPRCFQVTSGKWYPLRAAFHMFDRLGIPRAFQ